MVYADVETAGTTVHSIFKFPFQLAVFFEQLVISFLCAVFLSERWSYARAGHLLLRKPAQVAGSAGPTNNWFGV
jgi:hypothetical protein